METTPGWRAAVICPNRNLLAELRRLLAQAGLPETRLWQVYPAAREVEQVLSGAQGSICFLDVGSDQERALRLLGDVAAGSQPVVALHTSNDPDLILRCLRYGASEFLFLPFTLDLFLPALERLARRAGAKAARTAAVYCCMPGKPSSGSTTIACNLAMQFHRLAAGRVLLADVDSLMGSISFLLKLKSNFGLADALRDWMRMDEEVWKQLVTDYHGVDVLLSPESPAPLAPEPEALPHLLEFWKRLYGAVLFDTAGVYSGAALEFARACDTVLLVTTNELSSLHASRRTLEYLAASGVETGRIKLIVNRYTVQAGLDSDGVERALGCAVYHLIPNDFAAAQSALLDGRDMQAGSKLGAAVAALAAKLTGAEAAGHPARPKSLLSFLHRTGK